MNNNQYLKDFIKYSSLNILGMIGLSCYILADTFFISKGLGPNGLAALNIALPAYSFISGCGLMLSIGGATKFSIAKSQGNDTEANKHFSNTLILAVIFSALFVLIGIFFSKNIAVLLGADEQIFKQVNIYLKVLLLFSPAFIFNNIFNCFVRNDGNPNLAMTAMLTGCMFNIILDYILIFPANLGMFGAVLATGFAPVVGMLILSRHLIKKKNGFHIIKSKPNFANIFSILSLGLPSFITELSSGLVIIAFNVIILNLRGNIGVAAYGVIANISLVIISVYTGIAQGTQPLISKAHGNASRKGCKALLKYAVVTASAISAIVYLCIFFFADPIAQIFNSEHNAELQIMAVSGMKLYFTAIPFVGFNIIISIFFTSVEKPIPAHIISLLRGLILIIPMAFLMSKLFELTGTWLAFPVTEAIVSLIALVLYPIGYKTKRHS
ncbi:MAG: MATE family efflux transporter [Faecalibacterium sp.]|nr:MATE family efflux transporter [Ruminococcus sp.]MCM1392983.1 MATE family efflux transporter [Ruminococcus sp.]MCM1486523.1 MATE family efflux transporter [Faecalibacterium sp.]